MKRWLKWAVYPLVLISIVAAIQGYYWVKATDAVNALIRPFKGVAKVDYQEVSAFLFSPVVVSDITVRDQQNNPLLSIGKLNIAGNSWHFFLTAHDQMYSGHLTEPFSLQASGLSINLPSISKAYSKTDTLPDQLCALQDDLLPAALLAYGYGAQPGEVKIAFEPSANRQQLKISLDGDMTGIATVELQLWLGNVNGVSLLRKDLALSRVAYSRLRVRDKGMNIRRLNYCLPESASREGQQRYLAERVDQWALEHDIQPSRLLKQALVAIEMPGSKAELLLEPAVPVSLEALLRTKVAKDSLITPSEVALTINAEQVKLSEDDWVVINSVAEKAPTSELASDSEEDVSPVLPIVEVDEVIEEEVVEEKSAKRLREIIPGVVALEHNDVSVAYMNTAVSELPAYIGREVKIKTRFGKEVMGRLVAVNKERVSVQHHMEQGNITFPIYRENIANVKVLR